MSVPFYIANAFTTSSYGGNPAVIIFLADKNIDTDVLINIARNYNQPIATFLWPSTITPSDSSIATYDVRWFTTTTEIPLCGHGTLAAAGTLFNIPGLIPETVSTIKFNTASGYEVIARKSGERFEISMAAVNVETPEPEEVERVSTIVRRALGEDVRIMFVGVGVREFNTRLLVEIEESDDLQGRKPVTSAFSGSGFGMHIITSASSDPNIDFVSRMFAPDVGTIPEDHVCGSAHASLGPYWQRKLGKSKFFAKQVSERGGELRVDVHKEGLVTVGGEVKVTMHGSLII